MTTEAQLESLCLEWFQDTGWNYLDSSAMAPDAVIPERTGYEQVVLKKRLMAAMERLNPGIPPSAIEDAAHFVCTLDHPSLIQRNRAFHKLLQEGVRVEVAKGDTKTVEHLRVIDFHDWRANEFFVVNQFTVTGTKQPRRPDIVVFVNGLPLSVLELKNLGNAQVDLWDAYDQLQTYKEEVSDLFIYNQALIASDGITARVGALTATKEWFMPWKAISNENDRPKLQYELEVLVRGFFNPELFLCYIRFFVLFEQNGDNITKKIAGYHQFHGVREAVRVTLIAAHRDKDGVIREERAAYGKEVLPGSKKAGVFWQTQGSGKSISMVCYAGMLIQQPEMNNPTLVVVTDRNDLDGQLFQQFSSAKDLLKQTPEQAESREQLREMLAARQAGGIIFTTVQKFSLLEGEAKHPPLCERGNVVVISDEAHRTQYGLSAKLNQKTGKYVFGYAKHMRDALPEASFIGFTGTPISGEDRDTQAVFGGYVSVYDIQDAVDDGATVPIYYESRLARLDINRAEIDELNKEVEEVIEDEEDLAVREKTKSKWAELAKLVGSDPRLEEVAADLVAHYETRTSAIEGKAMIVCMSRDICVALFDKIIALRPEWAGTMWVKEKTFDVNNGAVRIVMTGAASDRAGIQQHVFSKGQKMILERRFKDPADPLKLVIVRDMWLTGFDAPCCHTMYIDKPMEAHNLMQAIARVNRVFKDKQGGLVVDYIGIAAALKAALKTYTEARGKGQPTLRSSEALAKLMENLDKLRGLYHGFDYRKYETEAMKLLVPAANHVLGLSEGKKRFLDVMAAITKAFSLCSTLDEAADVRKEIAFFTAVRAAIVKYTTVDRKRTEEEKNSALKQILDNAVVAEGVADVFTLAGLDKPNIGLLSDEFLEDLRKTPQRNLAVELLEKLLRDEIKAHTRTNVVQEKKYGDRLLETLRKYNNRAIETAQVIEEMIQMAKDFAAELARNRELGLSPDEVAFYMALAENESAVRELGDDTLKKLAVQLTDELRKSTTVDWQVRDSVRAKLRILIRRLLRRYKYPPDLEKAAIDLVLQQAETLSEAWSA